MVEKVYHKIGDVSKRFNVNTSLIRYWEKEFDIINPKKNNKGTRYYTNKDIDNFTVIYHLVKEKGMTIQGVKEYLKKKREDNELNSLEVIATLKKTKQLLLDVKQVLDNKI